MNSIPFTKMAGAGNDFLVLDEPLERDLSALAVKMCSRQTGLGADGILLLGTSKTADYKMRILNPDGSEAEMCGNGARCLAAYIFRYKQPVSSSFSIETLAGIIHAEEKIIITWLQRSIPLTDKSASFSCS